MGDVLQIGVGLLQAHTFAQQSINVEIVRASVLQLFRAQLNGNPDLRFFREGESMRHNAHDPIGRVIQSYVAGENIGVAAESLLPYRSADERDFGTSRTILVGGKPAAQHKKKKKK